MDYMEAAALLGQSIAESGELEAWKNAENAMLEDEKAGALMDEYKELQMQMVKASREDLGKDEIERIRDILLSKQRELNEYEVTKKYFDAKDTFQNMMKSINDVIQFYVSGEQSCGGNCGGCSGCH